MKKFKFFTMVAAALLMAACSSDEIESVAEKGTGMRPLEIVPVVQYQTRAQITAENLSSLIVNVTGNFANAAGTVVENPTLVMTKDQEDKWSYTYNNGTAGPLYWAVQPQTATFAAHSLAADATVDEQAEQADAVGGWAEKQYDGENEPGEVAITLKHAVSKMQFKARVVGAATDAIKVQIDIQDVAIRNIGYQSAGYVIPTSEMTMGTLAVNGQASPATKDITATSASAGTYIELNATDATASTDLASFFMVPQTVTAADLTASTWSNSYLAVRAQIRITQVNGNDPLVESMVYPNVGAVNTTDYAWVAVPLPADFTAMQAHKKYIFTLNFSADALGKVDRANDPDRDDEGADIIIAGRSVQPVVVTVEEVTDFEEDNNTNVDVTTVEPEEGEETVVVIEP